MKVGRYEGCFRLFLGKAIISESTLEIIVAFSYMRKIGQESMGKAFLS